MACAFKRNVHHFVINFLFVFLVVVGIMCI